MRSLPHALRKALSGLGSQHNANAALPDNPFHCCLAYIASNAAIRSNPSRSSSSNVPLTVESRSRTPHPRRHPIGSTQGSSWDCFPFCLSSANALTEHCVLMHTCARPHAGRYTHTRWPVLPSMCLGSHMELSLQKALFFTGFAFIADTGRVLGLAFCSQPFALFSML